MLYVFLVLYVSASAYFLWVCHQIEDLDLIDMLYLSVFSPLFLLCALGMTIDGWLDDIKDRHPTLGKYFIWKRRKDPN